MNWTNDVSGPFLLKNPRNFYGQGKARTASTTNGGTCQEYPQIYATATAYLLHE